MNNFATDVRQYLIDNGMDEDFSIVNLDSDKSGTDRISVYTAGGFGRETSMDPSEGFDKPMCRIYVYSIDSTKAEQRINEIQALLNSTSNVVIGGTSYCLFQDRNGVNYKGRDNNNYVGYYLNISTIRRTE